MRRECACAVRMSVVLGAKNLLRWWIGSVGEWIFFEHNEALGKGSNCLSAALVSVQAAMPNTMPPSRIVIDLHSIRQMVLPLCMLCRFGSNFLIYNICWVMSMQTRSRYDWHNLQIHSTETNETIIKCNKSHHRWQLECFIAHISNSSELSHFKCFAIHCHNCVTWALLMVLCSGFILPFGSEHKCGVQSNHMTFISVSPCMYVGVHNSNWVLPFRLCYLEIVRHRCQMKLPPFFNRNVNGSDPISMHSPNAPQFA